MLVNFTKTIADPYRVVFAERQVFGFTRGTD